MNRGIVRLAQITDSHLLDSPSGRLHGVLPDKTLTRVLEQVVRFAPNHVIASGDLADSADSSAYARLMGMLHDSGLRVSCMPGNHDDPARVRDQLNNGSVDTPEGVTLGNWRILLLDSTVPGRPGGALGPARLAALEWQLHAHKGRNKLVFVHHQPLPTGSPWIDAMGLEDGSALLERLLHDGDVAAVAFGHIHHAFASRVDSIQVLGCPATSYQAMPRRRRFELDATNGPGFRWFELHTDGLLETGVTRVPPEGQ